MDQLVVDFYCPELKLAIEVDGSSHFEKDQILYDIERENYIKSFGIQFLRITNEDVHTAIESVLAQISDKVIKLKNAAP